MSQGFVATLETQHHTRHHFLGVQHNKPVHRPHKLHLAVAPAHKFGHWQLFEAGLDDGGQMRRQTPAFLFEAVHEILALVAGAFFQLTHVHAAGLGKAQQRRRRLAVRADGTGDRRTLALDHAVRLLRQYL